MKLPRFSEDEFIRRQNKLRRLVNQESKIGASIFGVPAHGGRQEFFLSPTHPNEWVWHQETADGLNSLTVRYIFVQNEGIFKSIHGGAYERLEANEQRHLIEAIRRYHQAVTATIYAPQAA